MRKKRIHIENATYHVTSRTNNKTRIFETYLGRRIMLLVLEKAKEKYGFRVHNFCIMPNHVHLLLTPSRGTNISRIIQWIKTKSAKIWNGIHGSENHIWGERFFSRPIKDASDYFAVYNYIDRNPVKAALVINTCEWKASGAYHIVHKMTGLVDYTLFERLHQVRMITEKR